MALKRIGDIQLEVLDTGDRGGTLRETICFSHGLLWDHRLFLPQIEALKERYRCVAWDHRGQGRSEVPEGRAVSIERVTTDAVALLEDLGVGPVHFVGLSMGGFVGMRIAARRPDLIRSLCLLQTAPDPEPTDSIPKYRRMNLVVRLIGVRRFMADRVLNILCGASFLADPQNQARVDELRGRLMALPKTVIRAVNGVLEREGIEAELPRIHCPTLVLRGTEDAAISRERARKILLGIKHAKWVEIERCGHTSTLERPEPVTEALEGFLASVGTEVAQSPQAQEAQP